ncbi:putative reverse transcriptase zinc-binding domain-containing protein [Helianthus annuus]|nr:putative reverse transcriptase zinc-binding domain-containing protein [Helianthus annuus]KAJ0924664.1 putative reverse transcriptase zinc-binding domain-containing protein [Helianthus annuus]
MCVFLTTFFTFSFGCDAGKHQQAFELAGGFAPLKCFDDFKRTEDKWVWGNEDGVDFSAKSIRVKLAVAAGRDTDLQRFHWNSWVMPKVNYLIWRAILGGVDTKDALVRRGVNLGNTLCCRCGLENEDVKHVFVGCLAARSVWWQISMVNPPFDGDSVVERVDYFNNQPGAKTWKKVSLRGHHPSLSLDGLNLKRQLEGKLLGPVKMGQFDLSPFSLNFIKIIN